jgi:hypothetical protein
MHPYECLKIGKWIFLIPVIGMLTQSKFHKEFTTWFIDHTFLKSQEQKKNHYADSQYFSSQ